MGKPNSPLQIDLMELCIKHNLAEYVFAAWSKDNEILILANAEDRPTWPFQEIFDHATEVGKMVQQESKNRNQ